MKVGNENNFNLVLGHFLFPCAGLLAQACSCRCPITVPCRLIHMTYAVCLRDVHPIDAISHISAEIKQAQLQLVL